MPPVPTQTDATVLTHERVAPEIMWLVLDPGPAWPAPDPGQFALLRVSPGLDPLLRRPMSVFAFEAGRGKTRLEFLYRIVGRGTRRLSEIRAGDRIDLVGPLGRGFSERTPDEGGVLLVGGGMGGAPLVYRATRSTEQDALLFGCASADAMPVEFLRQQVRIPFHVATEDGGCGTPGLVTDLVETHGAARGWTDTLLAAGPIPMLRAVADLADRRAVPCEVSLEARMACGTGGCQGCVVPVRSGETYVRVCREGPVLEAGRMDWEAMA